MYSVCLQGSRMRVRPLRTQEKDNAGGAGQPCLLFAMLVDRVSVARSVHTALVLCMPQSVETELRRETQRQKARIVELEQELARANAALSAGTKTVAVEPLRSGLTPEARRVGTILAHSRATVSFVQPPLSAEVPSPSPLRSRVAPPWRHGRVVCRNTRH